MVKSHLFLLVIFLLTACQPTPISHTATPLPATVTKSPPTATPIPLSTLDVDETDLKGIEIEVWHAWYGATASLFDLQVAEFNKENPWGIKVSATSQGNYNLLFNAVSDSLESGDRPQIVVALVDQISLWNELGSVKSLSPYIVDPIWGFTTAEATDFPEIFLEQDQRDENQIALPAQRTARFLLYNQTWGKELGFTTPPRTFEEFKEQSCAANQAKRADEDLQNDGKGGWIIDDDPNTVLAWMRGFDGSPLDKNGDYQFISNQNIDALKNLKKLYDQSCIWLSTADTPYEQFANRSALFISANMEEFSDISRRFASAKNRDEWTILPYPGTMQNSVFAYGTSYAILEENDEAEILASWLFIKWMLTPENQAEFTKSTALFPIRISSLDELSAYEKDNPHWSEAVDLIPRVEIQPKIASWHQVRYVLGDGFEYLFRFDVQAGSVAAILAQMNTTAQALNE